MVVSIFIYSNLLFKTLIQSFYIALSHISICPRNKISAGVKFICRRNNYPRGRACKKKISSNFFFLVVVSQYRKLSHSTENESFHILIHRDEPMHCRMLLSISKQASPILIHWLGFRLSAPYLNTCIAYLNTLIRLSALDSNSQYIGPTGLVSAAQLATNQHPASESSTKNTVGSQSESSITELESSANQDRALRHPSRHPRALGLSRLAIAYLITWRPSPPTYKAHTFTTANIFSVDEVPVYGRMIRWICLSNTGLWFERSFYGPKTWISVWAISSFVAAHSCL